jgi:hypothetical protein
MSSVSRSLGVMVILAVAMPFTILRTPDDPGVELCGSERAITSVGGKILPHSSSAPSLRPRPYPFQRRKIRLPFVPPKPNEFDSAYCRFACRAWFGT